MAKPIIKKRRTLKLSDFRRHRIISVPPNIILVEDDGYIDTDVIENAFPVWSKRDNYLNSLIKALG